MIRLADKGDIPSLKEIWRISFGDGDEYINMFMDEQFEKAETVVREEDGKVVSMLFLFRCSFSISGKGHPSFYLYAAATLPEYRGRGIMGDMLVFSKDYASKKGMDFIILSPAEKGLYDYYGRFGFLKCFGSLRAVTKANGSDSVPAEFEPRLVRDNLSLRNGKVEKADGVLWDEDYFKYALRENEFTGGKILCTKDGYGMYYKEKDRIVFKEIIAEDLQKARDFAGAVCKTERCREAEMLLPADAAGNFDGCEIVNTGMAVALNDSSERILSDFHNNAYLGLTLG